MWGKKDSHSRACSTAVAWLIAAAGFAGAASAGSFSIDPVQISLPHDQLAASLTIRNNDSAPVSVRAQALQWTQVGGIDRYSPTANVIVSPPIFTIAAGETQLVRVGVKNRRPGQAYRLILEEIPTQAPGPGQIKVTLRLNLPLYVLPKGGGKPDVSWRAWRSDDGTIIVEGRNRGSGHLQVTQLLASQSGSTQVLSKQIGVILAGSSRIWKSTSGVQLQPDTPLTLVVKAPAGDMQTRIALEPR